jgi:outer membrane protein insertion porin family
LWWGNAAPLGGRAACVKFLLQWRLACASCICVCVLSSPLPARAALPPSQEQASPPIIERVDIVGNHRIPTATLRSKIFAQEGQPYNEDRLRRDFQALWNTQYFQDIRLEVENSPDKPNEVIVVFYVTERPIIRHVKYKGISSISESDILDRYKDRKLGSFIESPFDPTKITRAQVLIKELLAEHGRQFATVTPEYSKIAGTNAVELTFVVDEGPKVKVGKITFIGNQAFSDRKIIRSMRNDRPYGFPLGPIFVKVGNKTFDRAKLDEDIELGIRSLYQDNGYFTVVVRDPKLETVDVRKSGIPGPWPFFGARHGKATNITITIDQGERYRMGKLIIRSHDPEHPELVFKTEFLEKVFPLKRGDIFSTEKVRKSLEDYKDLFGNFGFIDFTAQPQTDVDVPNKVVNLTLEFDEQKAYHVRRIEFVGNTTTRDKVIRRQLLLDEGDLYSNRLWELSILRINQLDYFEPIKKDQNVDLKRNPKEGTVDITLKVREKGKQSIGLNGGLSGIAGTFVGFNYQTNNFLGLGETLNFSTQFGTLERSIVFGFTEPYFRDKPLTTGFTLFDSRYSFDTARETAILLGSQLPVTDPNATQNYNQDSKGFTVFASYPLKQYSFTRVGLSYGYTATNITAFSDASRLLFETLQFRSAAGPSSLNGIDQSEITLNATYNTVNSPINPTGGKEIYLAMSFVGGPLGGNVNSITPTFEFKKFIPVRKKRNVIGFRFLTAFTTGFGGKEVPPLTRLYLGGEQDVRGFNIRTVTPVAFVPTNNSTTIAYTDPSALGGSGLPVTRQIQVPILLYQFSFPGGDIESVGNFEYRIPLYRQYVGLSYFLDVGVNGILRRSQLRLDPGGLADLRNTFKSQPILDQLPLAQKSNFYPRSSTGLELVIQLPIVQVPFRIYYAYNLSRYSQVVQPPRGQSYLSPSTIAALCSSGDPACNEEVLSQQILPQVHSYLDLNSKRLLYSEPLRTIRFTVARTF